MADPLALVLVVETEDCEATAVAVEGADTLAADDADVRAVADELRVREPVADARLLAVARPLAVVLPLADPLMVAVALRERSPLAVAEAVGGSGAQTALEVRLQAET